MAPKTVGRYVKHPTNLAQKLDNIGKTLQLIKDQDIKLVNIGKESLFTSVLRNLEFVYTPYAMCSQLATGQQVSLIKWTIPFVYEQLNLLDIYNVIVIARAIEIHYDSQNINFINYGIKVLAVYDKPPAQMLIVSFCKRNQGILLLLKQLQGRSHKYSELGDSGCVRPSHATFRSILVLQ